MTTVESSSILTIDTTELSERPIFAFTSDIEWAPEWAIERLITVMDRYDVPLTPFVTHESFLLRQRYSTTAMRARVGVHPNFLETSSHGDTPNHVVDFVHTLWPEATGFRSHCFFDNTHITAALVAKGFTFDSNLCLFLQPHCMPLLHQSGLVRFPVFWEDDVHFVRGLPFQFDEILPDLDRPGLKVINVHPFLIGLNAPSQDFYRSHKHLYSDPDGSQSDSLRFSGKGAATMLEELLDYVRSRGHRSVFLRDLHLELTGQGPRAAEAAVPIATSEPVGEGVQSYQSATTEKRAETVRSIYDARDTKQIYATSPDFHLRELEIDFIARHLQPGEVLDLGCGNGYTILSLAKRCRANYIGLDFSEKMLEGAKALIEEFASELGSIPEFRHGDVRQLDFPENSFDCVISERCLQNLPTREDQFETIRQIHRVLKNGGLYLMVEGTDTGLARLNDVRVKMGLPAIPPVSENNVSALRFDEAEIDEVLAAMFKIEEKQFFGTYYLISRVVHPLLVAPEKPRFDANINLIARRVAEIVPDVGRLGHVMGYKLSAQK